MCSYNIEAVYASEVPRLLSPANLRLDGDAALPLDLELIQHLLVAAVLDNRARVLEQSVRQCRLPVVCAISQASYVSILYQCAQ